MPYQMYQFGSGDLVAVPLPPYSTINPTPVRFATLQSVDVEFSGSTKELFGKLRAPVAVAATEMKITGKAKVGNFKADLYNLFYGGSTVTGQTNKMVANEQCTGAASVPVSHGATFVQDLGVFDTVTGLYMTSVGASGTVANANQYKPPTGPPGQYSFFTGFTDPVLITYSYSTTGPGAGYNMVIQNTPMGSNPLFKLYLGNGQFQGLNMSLVLYQCGSSKLTFGWKNADFMIPEFDFYAMDNGAFVIGEFNVDQLN